LCRKFLYFTFLLVFSVLYTKKRNWRVQFLADTKPPFQPVYSFPQKWVQTKVLVCPTYALHEFTVLDNGVRPLLFPGLFFCLSSLCSQLLHHGSYFSLAQVFCPSTLAPLRHLSSRMLTILFSRVYLPVLGHVDCPC